MRGVCEEGEEGVRRMRGVCEEDETGHNEMKWY